MLSSSKLRTPEMYTSVFLLNSSVVFTVVTAVIKPHKMPRHWSFIQYPYLNLVCYRMLWLLAKLNLTLSPSRFFRTSYCPRRNQRIRESRLPPCVFRYMPEYGNDGTNASDVTCQGCTAFIKSCRFWLPNSRSSIPTCTRVKPIADRFGWRMVRHWARPYGEWIRKRPNVAGERQCQISQTWDTVNQCKYHTASYQTLT